MEYIKFGKENRKLSKIILGLMRIDQMDITEVEKLVDTALDNGINALDLADVYGGGKCEEKLGEIYSRRPELREKTWVQSKCGIRFDPDLTWFDLSKEHILESVDGILKRLHTDYIDSLLLHLPDALMDMDEIAEALEVLFAAGKVRDFGVSNFNTAQMNLLQQATSHRIMANQLQLSAGFTPMIDSQIQVNTKSDLSVMRDDGILTYCKANDIAVQAWSPLQPGFMTGVFIDNENFAKLNRVLDRIAKEQNVTKTAVAFAWILRYPAKMQVVTGTTKVSRILESVQACDVKLSKKEWYEIYQAAGNKMRC